MYISLLDEQQINKQVESDEHEQQSNMNVESNELPHQVPTGEQSTFFFALDDHQEQLDPTIMDICEELQPSIMDLYSVNPEIFNNKYSVNPDIFNENYCDSQRSTTPDQHKEVSQAKMYYNTQVKTLSHQLTQDVTRQLLQLRIVKNTTKNSNSKVNGRGQNAEPYSMQYPNGVPKKCYFE
ncbi:uncharacterized protein [Montipora foliosa]|uniref:uncharacterized protein n=1 Tax=Montipora foliosa TaxID=591990 RepID=UPI0035F14C35